jgi:hypothetical protein
MKRLAWWSPEHAEGMILSSRWVQTFVVELPPLKEAELEVTLRYKVQAMMPVNTDGFVFHTRFFTKGKKTYGAAFLVSESAQKALPSPAGKLRVGLPLQTPAQAGRKVLLFIATPDGISAHYYVEGILTTSFAPIAADDMELRERILAECPEAELICLAPDPAYAFPPDLRGKEPQEALQGALLDAFPLWDEMHPRRLPRIIACLLAAAGIALGALSLGRAIESREQRNEAWKVYLVKEEAAMAANPRDRTEALLKAQGAPVPELFEHLATVWGDGTRIVDLEWAEGKLSLTARSHSALDSLRQLTADPWFHGIRIGDIKTQKDGSEEFTIEGGLNLDS